jgi:putative ABC transport system permease protein
MAVGLLALVVAALLIYQRSLLREFATDQARPPDLFAFNITDQDRQAMQDWLAAREVAADFAPLVFARLRTIDGESIAEDTDSLAAEDDRDRHFRRREQRLSWRRELATSERIVAGEWMDVDAPASGMIEASVEEEYAEALGVDLGDTLGLEIQGVPLTLTVTSLREVRWASMQPNFFILVTPSALAGAPGTWVASFYCPDPVVRDGIQVRLVERFPQITILDVEQVLGKVRAVLDKVSWAVSFMAVFVLIAGLVVLAAVGLVSARERLRDAALLRVLGGTGRTLGASLAAEFGVIGLASAIAGSALAVVVTASLLHLIDLRFTPPWPALLVLIVAIAIISVVTGLIACRRVFWVRPLVVLREE